MLNNINMEQETKVIVLVYFNDESFYFENCKVVETHDRVVVSDKTTEKVVGSFPINRTAWRSSATSTEKQ